MGTNERLKNGLVIVFVVVFNFLFWGGVIATATGAYFGKYLIYAALILCVVIAWGGLMALAFTYVVRRSRTFGIKNAAKEVGFVIFGCFFCVGGIVSAVGSFRLCADLAAWFAPDGFIYWIALITFSLSVLTLAIGIHVVAHEHAIDCVKKYQQQLLNIADNRLFDIWKYSPFATPNFDRITSDQYHEILVDLVTRGAAIAPPCLPGFGRTDNAQ